MFCPTCGSTVEEGIYCPNCGAQVEETTENNGASDEFIKVEKAPEVSSKDNKETKKKKKKALTPEEQKQRKKLITKLIVAGSFFMFGAFMIFIAIVVGFLAINNPAHEIIDNLEQGYYYSASSAFENDLHGRANKKLIEGLDERLDDIWEEYQSETYDDYDDVIEELDTIKEMEIAEISVKLDETISKVDSLHVSRKAFSDAQSDEDWGYYDDAILNYGLVIESDPNYEAAQAKIKELMPLYREEVFEDVDSNLEYGYYSTAFEELLEAKNAFPDDAEIKQKLADTEALIVAEADKLIGEKKYDEAIEVIEYAMEGYPESKTLGDKIAAIQKGRPVYLQDLTASLTSENYSYEGGSFTDANGIEHDGKFLFDPGLTDKKVASAEFYLEKKYTKFTATFAPNSSTNDKEKFTIEILVDGKVVKTIKNFTFKSENEAVEIDVTGASKVGVRVKSTDYNFYNYISMTDACVYQ